MTDLTAQTLTGRIAIYTRVSTDDQCKDPEGSLDNQRHRCCQYLRSLQADEGVVRNVWVFREEGKSGKDLDRPELHRLVKAIKSGQIDVLVFTELSRISRSVRDFLKLSDFLADHKVEWISLKEQFNTTSPHGKLITVILMALAEFERETTATRTRLAMRDRAERGLWSGGQVPFGYQTDPKHKSRLLVDEHAATGVRLAFETYLKSGSIRTTTDRLREAGYRRPTRSTRLPKPLSANNVFYLLRNPSYAGLKEINRKRRGMAPEEELALPEAERYRVVPAVWEPLVDQDTFDKVQALLDENRRTRGNVVAATKHHYVLSGVLKCSACGKKLEGGAAKCGQYFYYRHPHGNVGPDCGLSGHQAPFVEQAVLDRLCHLAEDDTLLDLIVKKANDKIEDGVPLKEREVEAAKRRLAELEAAEEAITEHMLAMPPGEVPHGFIKKAKKMEDDIAHCRKGLQRLEAELRELRAARLDPEAYRLALRSFSRVYEHLDPLQRADLTAYLLDRVEVRAIVEDGTHVATEVTIALLGESPEVGRYEKGAESGYSQPPTWLGNRPG